MRITKKAIEIGNGAAVYIPKEYSGKDIIVILPDGIEEIKKLILNQLIEYMPNIVGIYLYGSYARNEETKDSDIDILVVTQEKDTNIKNTLKDIDARVITLQELKKAMHEYPLLIMPIIKEATVMVNPSLLEELKNYKIDPRKLKWNLEDIQRIIQITKKFIEIDPENISPIHIYSLIMRIRVCYLIECLLKNKKFTNEAVKELLMDYGLKKENIEIIFEIYRKIREKIKIKIKINKNEIMQVINILEQYSKKIENETKKKIGKRD